MDIHVEWTAKSARSAYRRVRSCSRVIYACLGELVGSYSSLTVVAAADTVPAIAVWPSSFYAPYSASVLPAATPTVYGKLLFGGAAPFGL